MSSLLPIFDAGMEPVLLTGSNRSGKGAAIVIPNLLLSVGKSSVILDPKFGGENWHATAGHLQEQGHYTVKVDPTCTDGTAACWNPLLEMPLWPYDVGFVQNLVLAFKATADQNQTKDNPHWEQTSGDFIAAIMLHVVYFEQEKSLTRCWYLMTDPGRSTDEILEHIGATEHDPQGVYGWKDANTGAPTKTHPVIAAAMAAVLKKTGGDRTSVLSTAEGYFSLFRDPIIEQNTKTSDFRVADLVDEALPPVSLYLTVPLHEQARCQSYMRMFFFQLWRVVSTRKVERSVGWGLSDDGPRRLLLIMDEFPVLGYMEVFERVFPNLASLGVKVLLAVQTPAQIRAVYGRYESLTGNCKIKIFFRPETQETAQDLSQMCGPTTVMTQNRTYTGGRWAPVLTHVIASEQAEKRALIEADEIMRLGDNDALLFHKGVPYLVKKVLYYEDIELLRRSRIPAPVTSDRVQGENRWISQQTATAPMQWTLSP